MRKGRDLMLGLAAALIMCAGASAQMVVHAISGKVQAVNAATKTIDIAANDGSTNEFKIESNARVALDFDNNLRSESVNADKFQHVGDFAVVYYYGYDNDRTAVAVKDLGAGPFQKVDATVVSYDKKSRVMTVKDAAGKSQAFTLSDQLVVDTGLGVDSGRKYEPRKGTQVRVTYTQSGSQSSAVFVRLTSVS
jgi:outer membrane lipoprotein-sorting protein